MRKGACILLPQWRRRSPALAPHASGWQAYRRNALGFDHEPSVDERSARFDGFSLRNLLDQDANAPMLVVTGADDVQVPQHDTQVFQGRRDTQVHLVADTGHCAISQLPEVLTVVFGPLDRTLATVQAGATPARQR
jgi:esterase FrsA